MQHVLSEDAGGVHMHVDLIDITKYRGSTSLTCGQIPSICFRFKVIGLIGGESHAPQRCVD